MDNPPGDWWEVEEEEWSPEAWDEELPAVVVGPIEVSGLVIGELP